MATEAEGSDGGQTSHRSSVKPLISPSDESSGLYQKPNVREKRVHLIAAPSSNVGPDIDIVAIHSPNGDWAKSWTGETGFFWLSEALLKEFPSARVVSYGYNGDQEGVVDNLLWDLIDERAASDRLDLPIFIVAHSFGGTLAKQLFIGSSPSRSSWPEAHRLHSCIAGYMFFGTIHRGGVSKEVQSMIRTMDLISSMPLLPRPKEPPLPYQEEFDYFLKQMPVINEEFNWLGGGEVPTICFYETKAVNLGGLKHIMIVPKEQAILPHAENRAIDASHTDLSKFLGPQDGRLQPVLSAARRLVDRAIVRIRAVAKAQDPLEEPVRGMRVLALDGGGVRGLFSIIVLEYLMEAVRRIDTPDNPDALKPCDYFDLICGTSTGGLFAIMLGRLRMDVRVCKQAYRDLSRQIFQKTAWSFPGVKWWDAYWDKPWFSGDRLETAIRSILDRELSLTEKADLGARGIRDGDAPLRSQHGVNSRCFVCALADGQRECDRLRSYTSSGGIGSPDCTIWQAGRATSAAPLYFPPISIAGRQYFDGGMHSNNPILELVREATQEHPNRSFDAIVSIGTGSSRPVGPGGGLLNFVYSLVSRVTDTELRHDEFMRDFHGLQPVYSRLQMAERLGSIDLADYARLDEIEGLARDYLNSPAGMVEIRRCAENLAKNN